MPVSHKDKLNIAVTGAAVAVGLFAGSPVLAGLIGGVSQNWLADLSWRGWEAARDRWLTPDGRLRREPLALASRRALHKTVSAFLQEEAYRQLPAHQQKWCRDGMRDWEAVLLGSADDDDTVINPQQIGDGNAAEGAAGAAARAVADVRRALLDTLFHDPPPAFAAFLQRQLTPEQVALRFTAELQQDPAARDAYQQLLLENVARQANILLAEQQSATAELQATLAAMQKWQAKSPKKQRAKFAKALAAEMAELARQVEAEGAQTRARLDQWGQTILDKVEPALTFPVDNLPARNPHFVGRVEHLHTLAAHFSPEPLTITQAITGLGGVGKSQLMLAFAHQERTKYDILWRVRVDEALAEDFLALGRALRLAVDGVEQAQAVETVRQWLNSCPQRWLLLYDNADETAPGDLYPYLPTNPRGRILITSRYPHWQARGATLRLDVFTPAEAVAFWQERLVQSPRLNQSDADTAAELAKALGRLPLALEHAAAYMNSRQLDAAAYLGLYRQRRQELWQRATPPDDYHATITTTWEIAFAQARRTPGAADLLNLCCFLAPDDIPLKLLMEQADALPEELAAVLGDPLARDDALAALERYSLLQQADGTLRLHRLVQEVARDRMGAERAQTWVEAALEWVYQVLPDWRRLHEWVDGGQFLAHMVRSIELAVELGLESKRLADLCNETGYYLHFRGAYAAARPYFERALAIREKALGPDHPDTAQSLNNLGALLKALGELAAARPYYERALAIREKALGPDHPDTAQSLNNLGALLDSLGELAAARPYYERALAIREKALGPDHPDTATSINDLAGLFQAIGEYKKAMPLRKRVLEIYTSKLGENHPWTATSLNNLGFLLRAMGELAAARPYYERALAIREKALGPDHPDTARSLNNLGFLLQALGELAAARPYYERALAIREKALGPDHPDTAQSLNNLAVLAYYEGDKREAARLMRRALAIREQRLGANHPDTQSSRESLAIIEAEL